MRSIINTNRKLELNKPIELYLFGLAFSLITLFAIVGQLRKSDPTRDAESSRGDRFARLELASTLKERRLPQAIIIGTRKGGTRALAKFLEINPAIRSAHNEVHFFDRTQNYQLGLDWYRKQMPPTQDGQLTIEKSPAYFITSRVPQRIKAMNASIKLVVVMRDPVTRLISDFSQLVANKMDFLGPENAEKQIVTSLDSIGLSTEDSDNKTGSVKDTKLELERHVLRPDGGIDDQRRIIRTGMYAVHLERWLSVFSRKQLHFVDGERLIEEPHVELRKLEMFLGFQEPSIRKEHFVYSQKKGFYCVTGGVLSRENQSISNKSALIDSVHISGPVCLGKSKGRRHVTVNSELLSKLKSFYAPYNEYLLSMTGLDFTYKSIGNSE